MFTQISLLFLVNIDNFASQKSLKSFLSDENLLKSFEAIFRLLPFIFYCYSYIVDSNWASLLRQNRMNQ